MRALFYFFLACLICPVSAEAIRQVNYIGDLKVQNPSAIASDNEGRIYIAQQEEGLIRILDRNLTSIKTIGGSKGPWPDLLVSPSGLCCHKDKLYVTDTALDRISVFTRDGDFIECYGRKGGDPGEFDDPSGICIYKNVIYVADTGNNRIQALGENGVFLYESALTRDTDPPLKKPFQVAVDNAGKLYAADKNGQISLYDGSGRYLRTISGIPPVSAFALDNEGLLLANKALCAIEKYTLDFKKILTFGIKGDGRGQFKRITAIRPTADGRILIADAKRDLIQIFSPDQAQSREPVYPSAGPPTSALWAKIIKMNKDSRITRLVYADNTIYTIDENGPLIDIIRADGSKALLRLNEVKPDSAAVDHSGSLYVLADDTVLKLSDTGKVTFSFGSRTKRSSLFSEKPNDMAITTDGVVYITDRINRKINVFNTGGIFIRDFASAQPAHPLLDPVALALDDTNRLYILDKKDKAVVVYMPEGRFLNHFPIGDTLADPIDLAVAGDKLYVLDGKGDHVDMFSTAGKPIARFAAAGDGLGCLDGPVSIAAKGDARFLVYEQRNKRLQEFGVRYTPSQPENPAVLVGGRTILLQWDKNQDTDVEGYVIYRGENNYQLPKRLAWTDKRSYVDETVTPGFNYYYSITAQAQDGNESTMTPLVSAAAKKFSVPPPTGLTAFPRDISVQLSWQPVFSDCLATYFVYLGKQKIASTTKPEISVNELLPESDYTFHVTSVSTDNVESQPATISATTRPTNRPPVEIEVVKLSDIFSNTYKSYEQDGLGRLLIRNNTSDYISKLTVVFSIKKFMDFPSELTITDLIPGKQRELLLKAVFNDNILDVTEDSPVQTEITASYYLRGFLKKFSIKQTINVYEKHKMRWDDPQRIGAFVTTKDPVILELVRNIITQYDHTTDPLVSACVIFNALGVSGISYVTDPSNSYQETKDNTKLVDYLQYPRETIKRKSGDCDDLAVLYAAALESIGTRTKFVEVPGHIFLMFMIGKTKNLGNDTLNDLLIIENDGSVWVPLELTRIGSPFTDAWEAGSRAYHQWEKKSLSTIDVHSAWGKYKPASLPATTMEPIRISRQMIDKACGKEYNVILRTNIKIQNTEYFRRLERNPNDADARLQLGIAYARYGILDEAERLFNKALKSTPTNASLLNNSANILFMNKRYEQAIALYQKAIEADPGDGFVRVNMAKALLENGKKQEAKKVFQEACRIDPDIAGKYRSLALKLPGPG